jgi:hypothetical protein
MTVLSEADPADKAEVYQQLGLTLIYDPATGRVKGEAQARVDHVRRKVSEGDSRLTYVAPIALATEFALGESRLAGESADRSLEAGPG